MSGEPNPNALTIIGAIAATLSGLGGLLLGTHRNRTDDMTAVVAAAMSLIDPLRAEVAALTGEVERLKIAVAACEAKHSAAQQELATLRRQVT